MLLSAKNIYLIGREKVKKGPQKGQQVEVVKRKINFDDLSHVSLRYNSKQFSNNKHRVLTYDMVTSSLFNLLHSLQTQQYCHVNRQLRQ